jgi:hypothetical protein
MWQKEIWLIDHGASLYFHHSWDAWNEQSERPFVQIKDHVLLPWASELATVDEAFRAILTPERIRTILATIPDDWINSGVYSSPGEVRSVYEAFLLNRLSHSSIFLNEAQHARQALV